MPTPPYSGYDLRNVNLMRNLSDRVQQTMLCRIVEPLTPTQQAYCDQAPFKIRTVLLPRPTPLKKAVKGARFIIGKYPVMAAGWHFNKMAKVLKKTIAEEPFDFIVLEGIWLSVYWSILRRSPARKVLNLYDLEAGLLRQQADNLPPGLQRMLFLNGARRMANLERTLPREADLTWTVSETERQRLLQQNPGLPIYLAPSGVDCDAIQPLPGNIGKEILFIGSMQYLPNVDGIQYFVKEVMPEVLKCCPDAVLRVVGRKPDSRVLKLHSPPSIIVTGEVDDVAPYYKACQLCVVPLRSGGGTRLKILEAMAFGRPVVSTTIGAEGIDVEHNRNILIADDPTGIADGVLRILNSPSLAGSLAAEGRKLVESRYAWKSIADRMYSRYEQILKKDMDESTV